MGLVLQRVKFYNALLLIALFPILTICFSLVIENFWEFIKAGLAYKLDLAKLGLAIGCVALHIFLLTSLRLKDFLYSILLLVLVFFVFPSAILFIFTVDIDYRIFLSHNLFFLVMLLIGMIKVKFRSSKIEVIQSKRLLGFVILVGIIPFIVLYLPYLNLRNFLLQDIYETRALMGSAVANLYTDYTYAWFGKVLIPCFLVFGIYYRDRLGIVFSALALLFLYLCGAHKAVFAGLIITLILYKNDYLSKANYLLKVVIAVSLVALMSSLVFSNDYIMVMTVRRAMFLPALVDTLYFDLFDGNHLYWSEIVDGLFKTYPYDTSHAFVIGEKYFGYPEWGANNGIVSDGFMNWGVAGVLLNCILLGFYMTVLNQLDISSRFFGVFFLFMFSVLSGSLSTVLLSHGGFVLLIVSFFFLKNTQEQLN